MYCTCMCAMENNQFSVYTDMVDYDEVTVYGSRGGDSAGGAATTKGFTY